MANPKIFHDFVKLLRQEHVMQELCTKHTVRDFVTTPKTASTYCIGISLLQCVYVAMHTGLRCTVEGAIDLTYFHRLYVGYIHTH